MEQFHCHVSVTSLITIFNRLNWRHEPAILGTNPAPLDGLILSIDQEAGKKKGTPLSHHTGVKALLSVPLWCKIIRNPKWS